MKTCSWEITKKCNLNCLHCISASSIKKELKTKDALKVIDNLNSLGYKNLSITGGEPLMRKDIFVLLKKAKEHNFFTSLISNGTLINNKNILDIKKYVDKIIISLDGSNSKINDKIRGQGSFNKTIKAIKLLNDQNILIILCITISKVNIKDLNNIIRLSKELSIKEVHINEILIRGRANKNKKILQLTENNKNKFKQEFFKKLSNNFIIKKDCDINSNNIFISPQSYLYPCIELYQNNNKINLGQLLSVDFKNIKKLKEFCSNKNIKKIKCPYEIGYSKNISFCLNQINNKCNLNLKK